MEHTIDNTKHNDAPSHPVRRPSPAPESAHSPAMLDLQRSAGNLAVRRLVASGVQPKLTVGQPDNPEEREANTVADHVMRSGTPVAAPCSCAGSDEPCDECHHKQLSIQRRAANGASAGAAPPIVDAVLRSPGQPLDPAARAFFEPRFGREFDRVRVHTGPQAESSARAIHARAYTAGDHIVFDAGQYTPGADDGRRLLAHELTHTIQQQDTVRRQTGPEPDNTPADAPPAADANAAPLILEPSISDLYPPLVDILPPEDLLGLDLAADHRYLVRNLAADTKDAVLPPLPEGAKTSIEFPLEYLLTAQARFVDQPIWETLFQVLKAGGEDALVAELLRNEIMRHFFDRNDIYLKDKVRIELADPEGKTADHARLHFILRDHPVNDAAGIISGPDLAAAFTPFDEDFYWVGVDVDTVTQAVELIKEVEDVAPTVYEMFAGVFLHPGDYAVNAVRGVARRLDNDVLAAQKFLKRTPLHLAETEGIVERFQALSAVFAPAVPAMEKFFQDNTMGKSLGMYNEEWGTATAGYATKNWEKGNYVRGAVGYVGTAGVAILDAFETVFSGGYHGVATEVSTAYNRGDLSWNDANELLEKAFNRAILVALITRGMGGAATKLGTSVAIKLGLTEGSELFGAVAGGVGGTALGAGGLATQAILTKAMQNPNMSAQGQAIWDQGMPGLKDWGIGLALGGFLGTTGGIQAVRVANARLIGTIVDTPMGRMKIIGINKQGLHILEPVGGPAPMLKARVSSVIDVPPDWNPAQLVDPDASALAPASEMLVLPELPYETPTGLAVAPPPLPTAPMVPGGQALVSSYLQLAKAGVRVSPSTLLSRFPQAAASPAVPPTTALPQLATAPQLPYPIVLNPALSGMPMDLTNALAADVPPDITIPDIPALEQQALQRTQVANLSQRLRTMNDLAQAADQELAGLQKQLAQHPSPSLAQRVRQVQARQRALAARTQSLVNEAGKIDDAARLELTRKPTEQLSDAELRQELEIADRSPGKSSSGDYVEEIPLSNDHEWKITRTGAWCRFSNPVCFVRRGRGPASLAPVGWRIYYVDANRFPDVVPHNLVLEFPGGERVWRMPNAEASIAIESRLGSGTGRMDFERAYFSRGEMGVTEYRRSALERAHSQGQGTGFESPYAIPYAPAEVNQVLQNTGIEMYLRFLENNKAAGVGYRLVTETAVYARTRRMQFIRYRIDGELNGKSRPLFSFRINVEDKIQAPRTWIDEFDMNSDPDTAALLHLNDLPDEIRERLALIWRGRR